MEVNTWSLEGNRVFAVPADQEAKEEASRIDGDGAPIVVTFRLFDAR